MAEDWTVLKVLDWTKAKFEAEGVDNPRLDAELLLSSALGLPRIQLYARFDQPLTPEERDAARALVRRRLEREPVAYILGRKEFWSLEFEVSPDVLIPRPDTELMVERALALVSPEAEAEAVVVDVGTGSGAVALAVKSERPRASVLASDVSASALAVARRNAERLGLAVEFQEADLWPDAPPRFDLVLANLPYIPTQEIEGLMPEVARYEPKLALDGGPTGLLLIERLAGGLTQRLAPGGRALLECGAAQTEAVAGLLRSVGLETQVHPDLAGLPRMVEAAQGGLGTTTSGSSK